LTGVHHANTQHALSGIFSPVDYAWSGKGIVSECEANMEAVVVGEVDLETLRRNREVGTVTQLKDRRTDLYRLEAVETAGTTTVNQ
jgi:predicted amidohydrolase